MITSNQFLTIEKYLAKLTDAGNALAVASKTYNSDAFELGFGRGNLAQLLMTLNLSDVQLEILNKHISKFEKIIEDAKLPKNRFGYDLSEEIRK